MNHEWLWSLPYKLWKQKDKLILTLPHNLWKLRDKFQFPTVKATFSTIFHGHEMPRLCYLKQKSAIIYNKFHQQTDRLHSRLVVENNDREKNTYTHIIISLNGIKQLVSRSQLQSQFLSTSPAARRFYRSIPIPCCLAWIVNLDCLWLQPCNGKNYSVVADE